MDDQDDEITCKAEISMKKPPEDPEAIIHHHDWPKGDDEDDVCQVCGMIRWEDRLHKEAYELAFREGYNTRMAEESGGDDEQWVTWLIISTTKPLHRTVSNVTTGIPRMKNANWMSVTMATDHRRSRG